MLISVNTVDPTFSFILRGARVQVPVEQLSRSPTTSNMDNNSMAILLDVQWYMPSQILGYKVSLCNLL